MYQLLDEISCDSDSQISQFRPLLGLPLSRVTQNVSRASQHGLSLIVTDEGVNSGLDYDLGNIKTSELAKSFDAIKRNRFDSVDTDF